ncbi:MAG: thermonuclease family protein [Candidatus Aenigmatarchaeota archaeon]
MSSSTLSKRNPIFIKIKLLISIILLVLISILTFFIKNKHAYDELDYEIRYVAYVIDGDTFVDKNGERVRLIGINTPEIGERCYEEAKARLKELIEKKYVKLVYDVKRKDRYNRTLAYVFVNDLNVNLIMIKEGYAVVYPDRLNTRFLNEFYSAEKYAKENKIGCLWKD